MKTKTARMQEYELINPSDAWTFLAPSDKIAWLVSLYLGRGKTPAKRSGWESPMYLFGGDPEADFQKEFGEPFDGALKKYAKEIAASMRTFMIHRNKCDRKLSPEELEKWNDEHRSSMNDFGGAALDIAKALEKGPIKERAKK